MTTTTYRGYIRDHFSDTRVTVQRGDGPEEPLRHYVRHSPSGFAWGYGGSGPAELARCILIDYLGMHQAYSREGPERLPVSYQDFKAEVIASWPWEATPQLGGVAAWELTGEEINEWLAAHSFEFATGQGRR